MSIYWSRPAYSCPGVQRTALRLAGVTILEHVIYVEAGQAGGHAVPASELHQASGGGHEHLARAGRVAGPGAACHVTGHVSTRGPLCHVTPGVNNYLG